MSSSFKDAMDGTAWENYCEKILRIHYGVRSFTSVPHADRGDHGLEFFTDDGTLFQCYFPDPSCSMEDHKLRVKKKINDDLNKLIKNERGINSLLDGLIITQWFLLIPNVRSKDLISYCNTKTKSFLKKAPSFINKDNFKVRIESDDAYPLEKHKARMLIESAIDFPVREITQEEKDQWKSINTNFHNNLIRKCRKIAPSPSAMVDSLIGDYLVLEDLIVAYREEFPELHKEISEMVAANLNILKTNVLFSKENPADLVMDLLRKNRANVSNLRQKISMQNSERFSIGFVSKWIAECKMDFILS